VFVGMVFNRRINKGKREVSTARKAGLWVTLCHLSHFAHRVILSVHSVFKQTNYTNGPVLSSASQSGKQMELHPLGT
jgi:hypothetical protein